MAKEVKIVLTADASKVAGPLDFVTKKLDSFGANASTIATRFTGLTSVIGGLTAAFGGFSIAAFVKQATDAADQMGKLAQQTGVTVERFSALSYAGQLADVSNEQLSTGLRVLAKNMVDVANGTGESKAAFAALGISVKDASGNLRGSDQILAEIADQFAGMQDGASKTALAMKIFGESGARMIPMLNGGSAGLRDLADEAKRLGLIISNDTAKAAEAFNDSLTRLRAAGNSLSLSIAKETLPALSGIAAAMADTAREAGLLRAAWVGLGGLGAWAFTDEFDSLDEKIKDVRQEIYDLERHLKDKTGPSPLHNWLFGTKDEITSKIAKLRQQLAALQQERNAPPKPSESDQAAEAKTRAIEARMARERNAANAAAAAKRSAAELDALLAGTTIAQNAKIEKQYAALNKALLLGKVEMEQYDEAVQLLKKSITGYTDAEWEAAEAAHLHATNQETLTQALETRIGLQARANKAFDDAFALVEQEREAKEGVIRTVREYLEGIEQETDLMLLSNDGRERAIAMRILERDSIKLTADELGKLRTRMDEVLSSRAATRALSEQIQAQAGVFKSLEQTAHDTFVSIFEGGKGGFERLRDTIKNTFFDWLYQMTIKKWVINVAAGFSPAAASQAFGAQAVQGAGAAAGGYGSAIASFAGNAIGGLGLASQYAMTGIMNTVSGTGLSASLTAAAEIGGMNGAGMALGSLAVPLAAIAGIAALLNGKAWAGDPDAFLVQGAAGNTNPYKQSISTAFGEIGFANGTALINKDGRMVRELGETEDISGEAMTAVLDVFEGLDAALAATLSEGQVASVASKMEGWYEKSWSASGKKIEGWIGDRYEAIFAAMETPLGDLYAAMDLTAENVADAVASFAALNDYLGADLMGDALAQIETAGRTAFQTWEASRRSVADLARDFDGTLASASTLASATSAMYQQELALVGQIQGLLASTQAMFGDSIRSIEMSVLDSAGKYDYLRAEIDSAFASLGTAVDPAVIGDLASQINRLTMEAYGLLDEGQRGEVAGEFVDYLNEVDALTTARLNESQAQIVSQHQAMADSIESAIVSAMERVAARQEAAAAAMERAAATPVNVNVNVSGASGSEVGWA